MGDYIGRPKCKLLTGNRPDENSPETGLLSLKKKRIIMVSEPEANDKLNSGFIKMLSGNDSVTLRRCHKNDMEIFKPNFITFLVCNDIPNIDNIDNAFTKKLRCINFPTEFVSEQKLPHQKKIDETLQTKLIHWKNDFMLLLLEYYNKFKLYELKPTKNVLEWTNMYKEEVDIYFNFLNDCTEDGETHISNVQLYEIFKLWFKNKFGNEKIPSNRVFVSGVRKYKKIEKNINFNKLYRIHIVMNKLYNFINDKLSKDLLLKDIKDNIFLYIDIETINYCKSNAIYNNNKKYNRKKLHEYSNDLFEIILICWDENSETSIHDHPEKGCILYLIDGILEEQIYDVNLTLHKTTKINSKTTSYMENSLGYHKIKCINNAISLHIYSPPNYKIQIMNK
jgi:hypothetical protein